MRLTESRLRRIIREELLREGAGGGALTFGQPTMDVYEETLSIKFPYTLKGEAGEAEYDITLSDGPLPLIDEVIDGFAMDHQYLAFQADESIADIEDEAELEQAAQAFIKSALQGSIDMKKFESEMKSMRPNRILDDY